MVTLRDATIVAVGGALGSVLRYLAGFSTAFDVFGQHFPRTLAVNVLGSFVIGVVGALVANRSAGWYFLATGLMGGFTTYSAFSLESIRMFEGRSLDGQPLGDALPYRAMLYIVLTTVLSLALCWVGIRVGQLVGRLGGH